MLTQNDMNAIIKVGNEKTSAQAEIKELKEESLFMKNMREVSAMKAENEELKEWNDNLEKTAVNQYIEIQELKKEIKELDKSHREDINEWVEGDKISHEQITNLKKENEDLKRKIRSYKEQKEDLQERYARRCRAYETLRAENGQRLLQVAQKHVELENVQKENEALHKGWKITEIEKIRKENEELKVEKQSMVIRNLKRLKKELKETSSYWKNIKENEVAIKQAEIKELKKEIKFIEQRCNLDGHYTK